MKNIRKVKPIIPRYAFETYAHVVRPLTEEEGCGFLITFPDLPGCVSDGGTMEEAIKNGREAFLGWIAVQAEMKRDIPKPEWKPDEDKTMPSEVSGKFIQRLPKSLHAKLVKRAKQEGVSLNSLTLSLIAEGIGRKEAKHKTV